MKIELDVKREFIIGGTIGNRKLFISIPISTAFTLFSRSAFFYIVFILRLTNSRTENYTSRLQRILLKSHNTIAFIFSFLYNTIISLESFNMLNNI